MSSQKLDLLCHAIAISSISTHIFCPGLDEPHQLASVDLGLRQKLYLNYSYTDFFHFFTKLLQEQHILHYTDSFGLHYFFLQVPREEQVKSAPECLAVGPFRTSVPSEEEIQALILANQLSPRSQVILELALSKIPLIELVDTLETLVTSLTTELFKKPYQIVKFPAQNERPAIMKRYEEQNVDAILLAKQHIEDRYASENELLSAIAAGSLDLALQNLRRLTSLSLIARNENPIQNQIHLCVILNTLCRKTVEQMGIHPIYVDDLSTRYAHAIYSCQNNSDFSRYKENLVRDYTLLVREHKMRGHSPIIRDIVSYVHLNYSDDLNLENIAQRFQMSKSYLSTRFKKETSLTLTDFIHRIRLQKALSLLNSSNFSMTKIAMYCGYNSVNYFIRRFKADYGISPKQYQQQVRRQNTKAE